MKNVNENEHQKTTTKRYESNMRRRRKGNLLLYSPAAAISLNSHLKAIYAPKYFLVCVSATRLSFIAL